MFQKIVLALLLTSCGASNYDHLFQEYKPNHLEDFYNLTGASDVTFYVGSDDAVQKQCGDGEYHVNACNFSDTRKVFISYELKDWCQILVHELTHQSMYDHFGNSDSNHESEKFSVVYISKLCLGINIFP